MEQDLTPYTMTLLNSDIRILQHYAKTGTSIELTRNVTQVATDMPKDYAHYKLAFHYQIRINTDTYQHFYTYFKLLPILRWGVWIPPSQQE